jgi:hypothetical protein
MMLHIAAARVLKLNKRSIKHHHNMIENIPHIPISVCKVIHDISYQMLYDDRHDIGYFQYWGRNDHFYHGKPAPDHPLPSHHWQFSIFGMMFAQLGAMCSQLKEMCMMVASMSDDDLELEAQDTDLNVAEEALFSNYSPQVAIYQETVAIGFHPKILQARRLHGDSSPLIYRKDSSGNAALIDDVGNNLLHNESLQQLPQPALQNLEAQDIESYNLNSPHKIESQIPPIPDVDDLLAKL